MDARKTIIATSFFSAVLVLGAMVPLGYFGLQILDQKLAANQSEVTRVIIDLQTVALKEIQSSTTMTEDGMVASGSQTDPAIIASLEKLKTSVDELRSDQQQILAKIAHPDNVVASISPPIIPGSADDTLNQTVLFPMGKIAGPIIDHQIEAMIAKINDYGLNQKCQSDVMGYSDTLGGDKSNLKLSHERATHVASLLRGKQISVGNVKGWGERRLKVHTVDGIQNEENRRVVIETKCDSMPSENAGAMS